MEPVKPPRQPARRQATVSTRQAEAIAGRSRLMKRERERVQATFEAAGLEYVPSHTNLVMVRAGPGVFSKAGVLVREGEALGVTEENDRLLAVLSE